MKTTDNDDQDGLHDHDSEHHDHDDDDDNEKGSDMINGSDYNDEDNVRHKLCAAG